MTEFLYIVFGCVILFALWFPGYARRQAQRSVREEVLKSLSERDPKEVIQELDARIQERLDEFAELEKNAGVLHASGADELMSDVNDELILLRQKRKIVIDHMEDRR